MESFVARDLEGYAIRNACNQVSTFREKLQFGFGRRFVHFRNTAKRTQGHFVEEIARLFRFIEDGKDSAVKLLVILIILLSHSLIEEPLLGDDIVRMLRNAPVKLPSCIGSEFVITAIKRVLQDETSVSLTILQFELLTLNEVTILIEQLRIKHATYSAGSSRIATTHISLIIKGVAQKIASIVCVDEDLLLRNALAKLIEPFSPPVEGCRTACLLSE